MKTFLLKNLQTLIQNRFISTSSTIQLQNPSSFRVEYLINSCGLSSKSALSTSQKLKLDQTNIQNSNLVIEFLKANEFDDTQIVKLVQVLPKILMCKVEKNLKPKFDYFVENGCKGTHLTQLVVSNPNIIRTSLEGQIKPSFEILLELFGCIDDVLKASRRCPWFFSTSQVTKLLKPNIDFLVEQGIPFRNLMQSVLSNPRIIFKKRDVIVRDFNAVKRLGLDPKDPKFCCALRVLIQTSESILLKKMEMYNSLGWTQEEIFGMFRYNPISFAYSEEKIRSSVDYLVNTMKMELEFVISHPYLLSYSMDRMHRRYKIFKALESKELFQWETRRVASVLSFNEKVFIKYYIAKYENAIPGLLEMNKSTAVVEKLDI
ncbi:hypothetical protein ACFE04_002861 [Oxalis oulophora]